MTRRVPSGCQDENNFRIKLGSLDSGEVMGGGMFFKELLEGLAGAGFAGKRSGLDSTFVDQACLGARRKVCGKRKARGVRSWIRWRRQFAPL